MAIYVKQSGAWELVSDLQVKQAGAWVPVNRAFVKVSGAWQEAYSSKVTATIASNATNVDISTLFSSEDWTSPYREKIVNINSGVIVGSSNTAVAALRTGTGRSGALTINNAGEIQGAGGPANSGVGGPALNIQQTGVVVNNTGAIRGGGGGGGHGGAGGQGGPGYYYYTAQDGEIYNSGSYYVDSKNGVFTFSWGGYLGQSGGTSYAVGGYTYYEGSFQQYKVDGDGGTISSHAIYRQYTAVAYTSGGGGGAGGDGGAGKGYGQAQGSGSAGAGGAGGGTNAGSGGTGGTGGAGGNWGSAGATGNTGATGNSGNNGGGYGGAAGSAGGAAGAAIIGLSRTLNNTGTINGAT